MFNIKDFLNKYILPVFGLTLMSKNDIDLIVKQEIARHDYRRIITESKKAKYKRVESVSPTNSLRQQHRSNRT